MKTLLFLLPIFSFLLPTTTYVQPSSTTGGTRISVVSDNSQKKVEITFLEFHIPQIKILADDNCGNKMGLFSTIEFRPGWFNNPQTTRGVIQYRLDMNQEGVGLDDKIKIDLGNPERIRNSQLEIIVKVYDKDKCGGNDDSLDINPNANKNSIHLLVDIRAEEIKEVTTSGGEGSIIGKMGVPITMRGNLNSHNNMYRNPSSRTEVGEVTFLVKTPTVNANTNTSFSKNPTVKSRNKFNNKNTIPKPSAPSWKKKSLIPKKQ